MRVSFVGNRNLSTTSSGTRTWRLRQRRLRAGVNRTHAAVRHELLTQKQRWKQQDERPDPSPTRFATAAARRQHRTELEEIVRSWARTKTRQEIWDGLRELDYFGAPVLSLGEVIEDRHIKERRAFIERDHPTAGPTTLLAPWIHLSKTPTSIHHDAPTIGQHTDEVLATLGLTTAALADLRAQGVIQ
jgi:crotonobetainyl-CoA:carnitine CoA-transferase CaiB-like acyl-CoA transferase